MVMRMLSLGQAATLDGGVKNLFHQLLVAHPS